MEPDKLENMSHVLRNSFLKLEWLMRMMENEIKEMREAIVKYERLKSEDKWGEDK